MTTVAVRDGVMASDSYLICSTEGSAALPLRVQKIFRIEKGPHKGHIVGIAGDISASLRFIEWYTDPENAPLPLEMEDEDDDENDFEALILTPTGLLTFDASLVFIRIFDTVAAIGTGDLAALAAMHCGKTPAEAIEIAKLFDVHTGGAVQVMSLDTVE